MTVVVSVETVLLVLLVVLVAGLLRSHAEILRRLGPADEGADKAASPTATAGGSPAPRAPTGLTVSPPTAADRERAPAPPLSGVTPHGDAVALDFAGATGRLTLLAFLTSGCSTCAQFWSSLADGELPAEVETIVVTRGSERERPGRVRELAPIGVPVVMSSQAWADYAIPGTPYFVLVERSVLGEGAAGTWPALASLVRDAVAEEREQDAGRASSTPLRDGTGAARARQIDATLAAGGIGPGHPSLYPGDPAALTGAAERPHRAP